MPMEVANTLGTIGIFFAGLGFLLASFGVLWFVSLYAKTKESKQKEEK
jgi:chromate transport protein ChrA